MQPKANFLVAAGPLLLVLFIDGMGLGLVFPILNGLIFDPSSTFLTAGNYSPLMHNVIYGVVVGIFMLCWFFGAAMLGDLSDKIGRKKSLMICLTGTFLSYIISACSVSLHSLLFLIIGRVIAGFTAGSQPIAQAAIVDLSDAEHKTRNLGFILLAMSLGFIFGPLLGGLFSDTNIVSWFNFATPFYFAAIIAFLNMICLYLLFNETFVAKTTSYTINPLHAISVLISAFQNKKVRYLSVIFFIFIFGWSSYYSFIAMYLLKIYGFSASRVSVFMAVMGVGFGIGNGFLANYFARLFPLRNNFIYSMLIGAGIILLMIVIPSSLFSWLLVAPLAAGVSVGYASILTIFSDQVDANSQGWIMGITGSIMAFVWGINGIVVGVLAALDVTYPMIAAVVCLALTGVFAYFYKPVVKQVG